ncbi:hypothetical protein [Mycobacterium lacus]|uniref:Uncharacterized protein n=1 Tax=Mycobacterium lacus TaxID=169765 RepID=A0A1X1XV70_9MYCO|nr:hypothetical protein [Mycobacterium lacus]MCV7122297.1 hypothetical protein [Mycobacterium lacus]ORW02650.1 hypothetical protein AWC15_06600 [Mycobacterium lacus]BBX97031.1 hypothetical protein MLAC_23250 [Mycobacterium lacus]
MSAAAWTVFCAAAQWPVTWNRGHLVVHGRRPLLVRVTDAEGESALAAATPGLERHARATGWVHDLAVTGRRPLPPVRSYLGDACAGLMGEPVWHAYDGERELIGWDWAEAIWVLCADCQRLGIHHAAANWDVRPCGHPCHQRRNAVPVVNQTWRDARAQRRRKP